MSRAAERRLARMLGGEHQELLAEWLTAAAARGLRPPAQLLPALLHRARYASSEGPGASVLRHLTGEVGGSRARWLAGLNPEWRFGAEESLTGDDAWRLGTTGQRRDYLTALRLRDPGAARELIAGSWEGAGRDERTMFLSILAERLDMADEPLLEAALGDPADGVQLRAVELLAGLPESAQGRRMAEHAVRRLRLDRGRGGRRLVVVPQAELEVRPRRGGRPGPAVGSSQLDLSRLSEIVARAPLRTWTEAFGLAPAQIVALPAGEWTPVLFASWSRAAAYQGDQEWLTALIIQAITGRRPGTAAELAGLRQLARRADPRLGAPGALPGPAPDAPPAIRDMLTVLRFRYEMLKELGYEHGDG